MIGVKKIVVSIEKRRKQKQSIHKQTQQNEQGINIEIEGFAQKITLIKMPGFEDCCN